MFIVHLAAPQSTTGGDFIYRVLQPDAALARFSGITTVSLTNICSRRMELLMGADLLVVQMLADADLLRLVLERRRLGRPTVFEVSDNFTAFQSSNPVAGFYDAPENRAMILQLISICDGVQVTMPALADLCAPYCERVEIFPNQVATTQWVTRGDGPLVVGWGGSIGHLEDVKRIAPAVTEWVHRNRDVRFTVMGDEQFIPLFADVSPEQFEFVPSGTLEDYFSFLRRLDVGIAPLGDHPFNSCRSDGKFIEYASRGVVAVCSDSPAYNRSVRHGETGFLFRSTEDLIGTLDALIENPEMRRRVSEAGYRYVSQERTESAAATRRLAFYRSLVPPGREAGVLTIEQVRSIPQLTQGDGERHFLHELSSSEQAAYEGLVSQFNWRDSERAGRCYQQASEFDPEFFQSRYYLGNLLLSTDPTAAAEELRRALAIDPTSAHAAYLLAIALWRCGQEEYALAVARALQYCSPRYAPGFEVEAEILMSLHRNDEAVESLRRSIEANPFYSPALVRLGVLCLDVGQPAEAEVLFRHAVELAPRAANVHWGLAVALHAQERECEAIEKCLDVIAIDPSATPAVGALIATALRYARAKDLTRAATILSKGLELVPSHSELLLWRARIAESMYSLEEARVFWQKLAESDCEGRYQNLYAQESRGDSAVSGTT